MRRNVLFAAVVAALAGAVTVGAAVREPFEKVVPLPEGGRVSLENVNGTVRIAGWERAEVRVEAVREADSRRCLDRLSIDVETAGSTVRIKARYPDSEGWVFNFASCDCRVDFTVSVPRGAELDGIEMVNGDVEISGVSGEVRAENVNGDVIIDGASERVEASTVNGGIEVTLGALGPRGLVELDSVNGRVVLSLPAGAGADIRAESVNGGIRTDFGLEEKRHRFVGSELEGTIGDGSGRVRIETVNGSIAIRKASRVPAER
ncbi:MAG: DUF4097 family beta strand repeat-containing protein [Acidobacteriota bacterium]